MWCGTDEVDSLLGLRKDSDHEATVGIKNEFMQLWDGFHSRAEYGVVVLGATNRREAIDPAALRRCVSIASLMKQCGHCLGHEAMRALPRS